MRRVCGLRMSRRLWSEPDDFDFDGKFFQLKAVRSKPKPYGGTLPVILNAARSEAGQAFAVRNADAFFTSAKSSEFDVKTGVGRDEILQWLKQEYLFV